MGASLNLVVIRVSDLEATQRFYEALGLHFAHERHGNGAEHLATELGGVVFEVYPRGNSPVTTGVRLGFRVASVTAIVAAVQQFGAEVVTPPTEGPWGLRAVVVDPEGHRVELIQVTRPRDMFDSAS
jgi:predicted enzyme related to lactoylglutathione lyase